MADGSPPLKYARRPRRIATDEDAGDVRDGVERHPTFPHHLLRFATLQVRIWNFFDRPLRSTIYGNQDYEPNHSAPLSASPNASWTDSIFGVCTIVDAVQSFMDDRSRRFPPPWRADKMPSDYVVRDAAGQATHRNFLLFCSGQRVLQWRTMFCVSQH
jgi:hypothetical protein